MFHKEPPIVISVGGSLIAPSSGINTDFLIKLNIFIRNQVKKGRRFFLVSGGGKTARQYRDGGRSVIGTMSNEDLDWLGIHASRLNGHLLRTIFQDTAHPRIIENYDKKLRNWKESVVIGAGWKPGWSTDYDAVILAKDYGANLIINLSNIDWIYDKDPAKYPDAKIIKKMTWTDLEKLVGTKWEPGTNAPFDPVATQLAKKLELTVIVTNGDNLHNVEKIVEGYEFTGTVIMPHRIDASFYNREYYTGKKSEYRIPLSKNIISEVFHSVIAFYRAFIIKIFLNPKNCLDIGCGAGYLVRALRKFGIKAFGLEISKEALELAGSDIKPFIKVGDIVSMDYPDSTFDAVVSFDVLEHVERGSIRKAIDETIRVSKKYVLHKIYTRENTWISLLHAKDYSHVSVLTKKFWQRIFTEHSAVSLTRGSIFRFPTFMESIFLLRKK